MGCGENGLLIDIQVLTGLASKCLGEFEEGKRKGWLVAQKNCI